VDASGVPSIERISTFASCAGDTVAGKGGGVDGDAACGPVPRSWSDEVISKDVLFVEAAGADAVDTGRESGAASPSGCKRK
jgi:hypothetical protein